MYQASGQANIADIPTTLRGNIQINIMFSAFSEFLRVEHGKGQIAKRKGYDQQDDRIHRSPRDLSIHPMRVQRAAKPAVAIKNIVSEFIANSFCGSDSKKYRRCRIKRASKAIQAVSNFHQEGRTIAGNQPMAFPSNWRQKIDEEMFNVPNEYRISNEPYPDFFRTLWGLGVGIEKSRVGYRRYSAASPRPLRKILKPGLRSIVL